MSGIAASVDDDVAFATTERADHVIDEAVVGVVIVAFAVVVDENVEDVAERERVTNLKLRRHSLRQHFHQRISQMIRFPRIAHVHMPILRFINQSLNLIRPKIIILEVCMLPMIHKLRDSSDSYLHFVWPNHVLVPEKTIDVGFEEELEDGEVRKLLICLNHEVPRTHKLTQNPFNNPPPLVIRFLGHQFIGVYSPDQRACALVGQPIVELLQDYIFMRAPESPPT